MTFASVSAATGLAPPTLVQRYRSRDGMMDWALNRAWAALEQTTTDATAILAAKGAAAFLKALSGATPFPLATLIAECRSPQLQDRAAEWRDAVEALLAQAMGNPRSQMEPARIAFAAWQGQMQWDAAGGKRFRLKDALRRIG